MAPGHFNMVPIVFILGSVFFNCVFCVDTQELRNNSAQHVGITEGLDSFGILDLNDTIAITESDGEFHSKITDRIKLVSDTVSTSTRSSESASSSTEGGVPVASPNSVRLSEHLKDMEAIAELLAGGNTSRPAAVQEDKSDEGNVVSSLQDILDVYNPDRLARLWRSEKRLGGVSEGCARDMGMFLEELGRGTTWAQKMSDASGRYSTGFLWGNSYWAGSATLCEATSNKAGPALHSVPTSPTSHSPFALGFYTLRLEITAEKDITPVSRHILLGICMPYACSGPDVQNIVQISADIQSPQAASRSLQIAHVRAPQHRYVMTEDPTFWVLVAASTLVFVMLVGGTVYDVYLETTAATSSFLSSNYTYHVTAAATDKAANGDAINNNHDAASLKCQIGPYAGNCDSEAAIDTEVSIDSHLCLFSNILLAFSVRRNMKAICDRSVGSDTIPTVHGLRSISMAWVILGHTCIIIFKYSDNTVFREVVETNVLFQTISNGAFSVDTFFFISGLLVSFLYFRTMAKVDIAQFTKTTGIKSNLVQFVGMLLYRFARLTVPYMFVLGAVEVIMKWFFHNSVFEAPAMDHVNCPNYWWRNVLYINTLFPVEEMCMLWSWYLADDTQFYIIGSVLLIVAVRHFRVSAVALVLFMVSSWGTTAYIAYSNDHMPNLDDPLALFDKIYDKPWTRLGPYLVGMAVGWILFKTDCKIKMNKLTVFMGWLLSTACLLALVFGLYNAQLHPLAAAAYSALSHTAWAVALAWIVIACSTGYGGYVNSILSTTILYPFSRVTYCAYLIHPLVIRVMVMRVDSPLHLATNSVMIIFFGQIVFSYLMSFVISLSFEAPIVSLLRLISPAKQKKVQ